MIINGSNLFTYRPIKNMLKGKAYEHGVSYGLGEAGYDIRIKQDLTFHRDLFMRRSIDRIEWAYNGLDKVKHDRFKGRFVLASSMEEFTMPEHLMGVVHDKSTWARRGLSVFNTVLEPGWNGFLTLELVYHGQDDLVIPAGSGIAQVMFHGLSNIASYTGRYQNQKNEPVSAIAAEANTLGGTQ